ncbi:uncharacterized protein LOC115209782 isoform X2 [Octopus sinensis]|uniref:Uncharacterized protein LOC115209782 isoform X2 n=1 Tax=Octopus sinensis TaxID=2607531 RepID=A0A7E6EQ03_9MOLL|nr:uncharacterized protein LOC115209782 isoform X2 [Octopus sinensis]
MPNVQTSLVPTTVLVTTNTRGMVSLAKVKTGLTCSFHADFTCHPRATCEDLPDGSFRCICPKDSIGGDGFRGENHTGCIFENEKVSCLENSTCHKEFGFCSEANLCECMQGYKGDGVIVCNDINECLSEATNLCDVNARCINIPGIYNCSCNEGYKGDGFICNKTCIDDRNCANNSFCNMDTQRCQCQPGFRESGELCIDINECEEVHDCHEKANCTNLEGSYNCTCFPGLNGNGINCTSTPADCQAILDKDNSSVTGHYLIDPDNVGPIQAFEVYCIMDGDLGITVIETDFYQQVTVGTFNVTYNFEIEVVKKIVEISVFCYQTMMYTCNAEHSMFDGSFYWTDGNGEKQYTWAGGDDDYKCSCGVIGMCYDKSKGCNCENNDLQETDKGKIIDKTLLPISSFTRTSDPSSYAQITFGNIKCSSRQFDIPKDCHEMKYTQFESVNVSAYIDTDGALGEFPPTLVYCDMTSENHVGITIVPNDWITITEVVTLNFSITYHMQQEMIVSLINSSLFCMQDMSYICENSPLMLDNKTFWSGRDDNVYSYWPGAMGVDGMCGCGILKSCDEEEANCNCDILDGKQREDFGTIIDKTSLPINRLSFTPKRAGGKASDVRVGGLRCSQHQFGIKPSCNEYRNSGSEKSYTYLIDVDGYQGTLQPFPVFCLMVVEPPYGSTIVHHHLTDITTTIEFTYIYASFTQLTKLIANSAYCSQTFTYHCSEAPFTSINLGNKIYGPGESVLDGLSCDCHSDGSCLKDEKCNCDANSVNATKTSDSVTISTKAYIPITKIEMSNLTTGKYARFDVEPLICLNILKSCYDIMVHFRIYGNNPLMRQYYTIDPDGYSNHPPFMVFCNFVVTEVPNSVTETDGGNGTTCFNAKYSHDVTPEQITALVKYSSYCTQYVNYQCYRNPGTDHIHYETCDGKTYHDMTGLSSESMCGCGLRGSCEGGLSHKCNCDSEANKWLSDSSYIHNKSRLAVCKVCVKKKSYDSANVQQRVNVNIYTLYCSRRYLSHQLTCQYHRNSRVSSSGEFFLLSTDTGIQVPVYCEMIHNPPTGITVVYPRDPIIEISVNGTDIEIPYFTIDMDLIIEIISKSYYCTQELTIFCNTSKLVLKNEFGWYSRDGVVQHYWPAEKGGVGCGGDNCNCKIENGENQEDFGVIIDKTLLPVSRIKLGPSEGSRKILIGPLKCYDVYRDCQDIKEHYMNKNPLSNDVYPIDPDGAGGEHLFAATCNFTDRYVAVTEVTHAITEFTTVTLTTGVNITLNYTLSTVDQIKALVNYSNFCHQDVEYQCQNTALINNGTDSFGYLVSYDGTKMDRFGIGYSDDGIGCACMVTGTCPDKHTCECDAKSSDLKWDGGVVVEKQYLPLTEAVFIPTTETNQNAKISISSIKCSSKPIYFPINCVDAYKRGMKTGSIFIQPSDEVKPFFVYCDMEFISETGVTIIRNEFETTTTITGKTTEVIYYNVTYVQIEALIQSHKHCYQPVKYSCRFTTFMGNGNAYWTGNEDLKKTYFGSTDSQEKMCTCGAERRCGGTGDRQTVLNRLCNCDSFDSEWKADAGVISIKEDLPIRLLFASQVAKAESKLTIGKIYCADEEINLNECEMGFHDCHVNATCLDTKTGFECLCNEGFLGRGTGKVATGRVCPDDNECRLSMCPWSSRCYNLPGTFKCVCYNGFRQTGPTSCEDIDECAEGTHQCDENANCFNTIGSYFCRCKRNFIGDGKVGDCRKIGICQCFGDPHCVSFDEKFLHFQGMCKYTLLRDNCLKLNDAPSFRVEALFWNKDITGQENSWVKEVTVFIDDLRIDLLQGKEVRINGLTTKLPYRYADTVLIRPGQSKVKLFADFGLQVSWDGQAFVKVLLEEKFVNSTCGLCGNFNDVEEDDWKMGKGCGDEGKIATSARAFGQSWIAENDLEDLPESTCSKDCENSTEPICTEEKKELATFMCDEVNKEFQECFDLMDKETREQFQLGCVYDLCFMHNYIIDTLCQYANALMVECQENMKVKPVVLHDLCRKDCGPNQEWKSCGKLTDVKTCFEQNANQVNDSKEQCAEGCFCKNGFVRQESECILPSDCGCVYNDVYYAIGDQIVISNCSKKAFCEQNGTIVFSGYTCHENASCKIEDGVYDCFCNDGFFGNGTQCYEDFCQKEHNCTDPAECVSVQNGFYCQCPDGYNTNCEFCEDVNECLTNTHDCDKVGQCINTNGSYECTCPKGYYMNENKCKDVDECEMKLDNCGNHSRCINTPGSFNCKCCSGYENTGDTECTATGSITPEEQATCCICHGYLCGVEGKICGTDGVSYENWADLIIKACEKQTKIKMDYHHECKKSCSEVKCPKYQVCVMDQETGKPKCVCEPCTEVEIIKKPVCSPVKVIYESFCDFKKFQCAYDIQQVVVDASHCEAIGDDAVSEWSEWGNCSVTCGEGTRNRTREPLRTLNVFEEASLPLTATSVCYLGPCNDSVCFDFTCPHKAQICSDDNEEPKCICPNCTNVGTSPVCARLYVGEYAYSEETFLNPCEAQAAACENDQDFEIMKDMECDVLPVNCTIIPNMVTVTKDGCTSEKKINVGMCSGGCGLNTGHCCNALAIEETKVNLVCPDDTSKIHTVKTVKRCDCVKRIFSSA